MCFPWAKKYGTNVFITNIILRDNGRFRENVRIFNIVKSSRSVTSAKTVAVVRLFYNYLEVFFLNKG